MKLYFFRRLPQNLSLVIIFMVLSLGLTSNLAAQDRDSGEKLYQYYCAQCHGEKGDGDGVNATEDLPAEPKDFTSPYNLPVFSDEQIINTITYGGPREQLSSVMPAWGDLLSAEEIESLRAHLRVICQCKFGSEVEAGAKTEKAKQE